MTDIEGTLATNRAGWNEVARRFRGEALPEYGPLAPTEDTLRLLEIHAGMRALELACGRGRSLRYLAEHGAGELWGVDLSPAQIAFATETLQPFADRCRLFESPMETNPGIPAGYFDLVFSIYGVGWTPDLPRTLALVFEYLRPGGCFVVSGEHPAYQCIEWTGEQYAMLRPYSDERANEYASWNGVPIVIQHRTLGSWITQIAGAGLRIETLVEAACDATLATDAHADPARWYSIPRARMLPTTFVIKARKPRSP